MIALARHCLRYRELLSAFIGRELRARYRGSVLGGLWMVLQPVVFLAVYYTVFVEILQFRMLTGLDPAVANALKPQVRSLLGDPAMVGRISALAMFVALIPWSALQECISRSAGTVIENANMIKKIAFPSELLPVYLVGYNLVNVCIGLLVFTVAALLLLGIAPSPELLPMLPVVLLVQGIFMLGLGYLVSTATVFIRDMAQLIPMAMTVWFFFTPIFYFGLPPGAEKYEVVMKLNPGYHLLTLYRSIFIFQPDSLSDFPWTSLAVFSGVSIVLCALGYRLFTRFKADFADEL